MEISLLMIRRYTHTKLTRKKTVFTKSSVESKYWLYENPNKINKADGKRNFPYIRICFLQIANAKVNSKGYSMKAGALRQTIFTIADVSASNCEGYRK